MPTEENSAETTETMNYNDRLDGYGFGEAECKDKKRDYENDKHFTNHCIDMGEGYRCHDNEPYTRDEHGLRNQYGPVDQYSFREVSFTYLKHAEKHKKKENQSSSQ